ncbi:OLC1v1020725C4 [Oldenlandia corymbosa var. corymbosa]|uniref:OLC1v1020725C4 n=1 Tax=Oldenlandia corymbosa var. corymbosa TaxID=529605 RepID=A0AAV1EH20_OLDCO|nr:OLC1v1020725C4 [Oldenlandia corymbosa var. corymbosa]
MEVIQDWEHKHMERHGTGTSAIHNTMMMMMMMIQLLLIALSEDMVNDGYCNIFNVDISAVVIQAMQKKYSSWPQLKFMQMDVRDMSAFEAGSFDALIDKGTLDSILCGGDSQENAGKMLKEVERVLKDGGIYFLITYGAPKYRLNLLRNSYPWTIKLHVIDKFSSSESSKHKASDLTSPVLLDDNSSSLDSVLGKNREVHYIYVCMKVGTRYQILS